MSKLVIPTTGGVPLGCSDPGHLGRVGQPGHQDVLGTVYPPPGGARPVRVRCEACQRAQDTADRQARADREAVDSTEESAVRTRLGGWSRAELAELARAIMRRAQD